VPALSAAALRREELAFSSLAIAPMPEGTGRCRSCQVT